MELVSGMVPELVGVNFASTFLRLLLAALFGGMVGMERGRRRRAAGMRTHMLVCMGATLVMLTNQYIVEEFSMADPSRLGAQVVSGIGFLGVGTIIVDRQQQVRGLTTAAGLWTCACMGLALGIGFYTGAIVAFVFILLIIVIFNKLEHRILRTARYMEVYAEFESHKQINAFINLITENSIKVTQLEIVEPRGFGARDDTKAAAAVLTLQLPKRHLHSKVLESLENASGLTLIEELR